MWLEACSPVAPPRLPSAKPSILFLVLLLLAQTLFQPASAAAAPAGESADAPTTDSPSGPPSGRASGRGRVRDFGIVPGILPTGPLNAITDVDGVAVGHLTRIEGNSIRTGITAIVPHPGNLFQDKVPAAVFVANGFGKSAGLAQIAELGTLETPILLTNTLSVAPAIEALLTHTLRQPGNGSVRSVNAVVGETNDGLLNDIRGRHLTPEDGLAALAAARPGPVAEGNVGAGTGTVAFRVKGGIGTSSRRLPPSLRGYTVGVLVQANFGGVLAVAGHPVGHELGLLPFRTELRSAPASLPASTTTEIPGTSSASTKHHAATLVRDDPATRHTSLPATPPPGAAAAAPPSPVTAGAESGVGRSPTMDDASISPTNPAAHSPHPSPGDAAPSPTNPAAASPANITASAAATDSADVSSLMPAMASASTSHGKTADSANGSGMFLSSPTVAAAYIDGPNESSNAFCMIPAADPTGSDARDETTDSPDGSCMIIVATDAPLGPRALERLARRAFLGLGRTGGIASNGSGDFILAFSTHPSVRIPHSAPHPVLDLQELAQEHLTPLFLAAIEATEEAILNALFQAETLTGRNGRTIEALPLDRVQEILSRPPLPAPQQ